MAFQENLNASIYMFSFFRSHDQMFLTVRGAVQGSFRATLGVASVFVHVFCLLTNRMGSLEISPPPPPQPPRVFFFGVTL